MPIGIALVLIFVLYLIDKHNRWRQAIKFTVALIVLAIVGVGGLFGWQEYESSQAAKQELQREAENAKQAAQKQVELAKVCKDWEEKHPIGSPLDIFSGKSGGGSPESGSEQPPEGAIMSPPIGCEGPLEANYNKNLDALVAKNKKPKPNADRERHVLVKYDTNITTTELSSLTCGHVKEGERAVLLEEGTIGIKIRTSSGDVGWASSTAFEITKK